MNEREFAEFLTEAIVNKDSNIESILSFEDAGLMTRNNGVVVYMEDGSSFQVTVVKQS